LRTDLGDKLNLDLRGKFTSLHETFNFSIVFFELDGPNPINGPTTNDDFESAFVSVATDAIQFSAEVHVSVVGLLLADFSYRISGG